ncbi:MAG: J domain-containing protein [Acidobacteriota bacterium]
MSEKDLYSVLGADPIATEDELRRAYLAAAKANHPDRFQSYVQKARATRRMQEINHAYSVLKDADSRRAYDARRTMPPSEQSSPEFHSYPRSTATALESSPVPWWIVPVWLTASGVFAYWWWHLFGDQWDSSYFGILYVAIVSLFVGPLLALVAAVSIGIPFFILGAAFWSSFDSRHQISSRRFPRIVVDFIIRLAALVAAVWLLLKGFHWGIGDLVFLYLLYVCGALAGELGALLFYVFRGLRTVKVTNALVLATAMTPANRPLQPPRGARGC